MKIDYKKASQLCNANEFRLVEQSRPNNLAQLKLPDTKRRAALARKLFDKWRELSLQQDRERGRTKQASERTRAKRDLFREVLNRFETRRKKLETAEARKKKADKKPKTPAKKRPFAAKPARVSHSKGAPAAGAPTAPGRTQRTKGRTRVTQHRIAQSGLTTRVRGHVSARGKRAQARRNLR